MSIRFPIQILIITLVFCHGSELVAQDRHQKFLDSLLTILPKHKEDSSKALVLLNIAQQKMGAAQDNGNWDEAILWYQKAVRLAEKINYQYIIGRASIFSGICWKQKGNYSEAIKCFDRALNLSLRNGNLNLRDAAYGNLVGVYMNLENYDEAVRLSVLRFQTLQSAGDDGYKQSRLQQTANNISRLYVTIKKYEEALKWYQKALPDDPKFFYEGALLAHLANVQIGLNQNDKALITLRTALEIFPARFKRKKLPKGVLGAWLKEYSEVYMKLASLSNGNERKNAYQQAVNHLKQSVPLLAENTDGKETLMQAYALLRDACEAINDFENALKYTKLYNSINDSIYSKQAYLKMADLKVQHETEKATLAMKAQRQREQLEEIAHRERLLAATRLQQEKRLAEEKLYHEKEIATQSLQKETAIAKEKVRHEKAIAEEKANQEIMKAEKERVNNLLLMGLIIVAVTSVFVMILIRQRQSKKRAVEKAEAIRRMVELELQSLRSQLNPHFMFNSLNSIQELILLEENDKSHSYLARFSKLLRMLLENAEKPFIPLQKELDFLQLYLGLENLRVPDLQYSISTDPAVNTEETLIPNMILQPYIENAIWHGLSHKAEDKQLQIRIFRENGVVNYEIEDNGVGRKKAAELKSFFKQKHKSKGMELLSKRFKLLNKEYSSEITTTITDVIKNNETAGTLVTIKVPVNDYAPLYS